MTETVGVIGLGAMGGAMARHLVAAGFAVVGRDPVPARGAALEAAGGRTAPTPRAVAEEAGIVLLSLPSVEAFEDVTSGPDGLAASGRPGLVVSDTSTLPIEVKERGRARLAEAGAMLLDCPLSGTGAQAAVKDVVVYASGDGAAVARCGPVHDGFARARFDLGAFGNGSRMKFVANLLVAVHNVAAAEAMVLGMKAGLDPQAVLEVVGAGAGTSRMFEVRGPMMAAGAYEPASMSVGLWRKDMDVIGAFAAGLGCPTPVFDAAGQVYRDALAQGLEAQDTASVCAVLERMAGLER